MLYNMRKEEPVWFWMSVGISIVFSIIFVLDVLHGRWLPAFLDLIVVLLWSLPLIFDNYDWLS